MIYAVNLMPLRPGVSAEAFAEFSTALDRPRCLAQTPVESFSAFEVVEASGRPLPEVRVVEVMGLRSWQAWQETLGSGALDDVVARFDELVDGERVSTLLTRRIGG